MSFFERSRASGNSDENFRDDDPYVRRGLDNDYTDSHRGQGGVTTLRLGAINTDGTGRRATVNSKKTLLYELERLICEDLNFPDFVTLTEVSTPAYARDFSSAMEERGYVGYYETFGRYDTVLTLYKQECWEPEDGRVEWSRYGRYLKAEFAHKHTKARLVHHSVHLPHKSGRARAHGLLRTSLEATEDQDVDSFLVGGDFNMTPTRIRENFPRVKLAFESDGVATTDKGGAKDNFLLRDGNNRFSDACVLSELDVFSHKPIVAVGEIGT